MTTTPETNTQTTTARAVLDFLLTEHASRQLPHWAHLSATTTGRGKTTFSVFGTDCIGGWINVQGGTLDEAVSAFRAKASPKGMADQKRAEAARLLREAEALEAEVAK